MLKLAVMMYVKWSVTCSDVKTDFVHNRLSVCRNRCFTGNRHVIIIWRCRWRTPVGVKAKVVNGKQTTSDPSPVAGEDHPRGRRRRQHQRTLHGQLSDARVVTLQMAVVEIIIADLRCLSNGERGAVSAYVCW